MLALLVRGAFGTARGLSYTLYYATTFTFTGLAVAVAFHAGLFNIGAEGQATLGGLGTGLVALWLSQRLPAPVLLPLMMVGGAVFGMAWAAVPAYLQAYRGSHIVITTIMFNFLASALLVYLLVNRLKAPGSMSVETEPFGPAAHLPGMSEALAWFGIDWPSSPLNLSVFLALAAAVGVWALLWRSRAGYRLRATGASESAAACAGIATRRQVIVSMAISGALAGLVGMNEIAGVNGKLLLDFVGGAGFTGIAVSVMGRNHPFGIVLASLLFGALFQGGAEVAFDVPTFSRDMVVMLQGFIVLFSGAMAFVIAPAVRHVVRHVVRRVVRHAARWVGKRGRRMDEALIGAVIASTLRIATPLVFGALAGLVSERAGVIDIGLEGKMLFAAFAAAAAGAVFGSTALALGLAIGVAVALSWLHGYACVSHRGDQVVSGMAVDIIAAGLTIVLGIAWFHQGGQTPPVSDAVRIQPLWPGAGAAFGPIVGDGLLSHNALVYVAWIAVVGVWWLVYRTRFGLRLRAVGENAHMVDAAGVSVTRLRYAALTLNGALCGLAGSYLVLAQNASFTPNMTAGRGYMALAAMIFGKWRPLPAFGACLLFGFLDAVSIRLQAPRCRASARCRCSWCRRCPTC